MPRPEPDDRTQVFVGHLFRAEPQIYGFLRAQVFDRNDADDLFQETAKVLWQRFSEFEEGTSFAAWAYQIARHKLLHYHSDRQKKGKRFSPDVLELIAQKSEQLGGHISDMRHALDECLEKLPTKDRDIVQRCYSVGTTARAVAEQLGRPFDTVRSALKRSRHSLLECIQRALASEAHS